MSQIENSLKILKLLRKNERIKSVEISKEIGITPRMVKFYITTLRKMGFDIEGKFGRHGSGYILHEVTITDEEWQLLFKIQDNLEGQEKDEFKKILDKIDYRFNKTF